MSPRSRVGLISMTSTPGPGLSVSVSTNRKTHPIRDLPAGNGPTGHIACVLIPSLSARRGREPPRVNQTRIRISATHAADGDITEAPNLIQSRCWSCSATNRLDTRQRLHRRLGLRFRLDEECHRARFGQARAADAEAFGLA